MFNNLITPFLKKTIPFLFGVVLFLFVFLLPSFAKAKQEMATSRPTGNPNIEHYEWLTFSKQTINLTYTNQDGLIIFNSAEKNNEEPTKRCAKEVREYSIGTTPNENECLKGSTLTYMYPTESYWPVGGMYYNYYIGVDDPKSNLGVLYEISWSDIGGIRGYANVVSHGTVEIGPPVSDKPTPYSSFSYKHASSTTPDCSGYSIEGIREAGEEKVSFSLLSYSQTFWEFKAPGKEYIQVKDVKNPTSGIYIVDNEKPITIKDPQNAPSLLYCVSKGTMTDFRGGFGGTTTNNDNDTALTNCEMDVGDLTNFTYSIFCSIFIGENTILGVIKYGLDSLLDWVRELIPIDMTPFQPGGSVQQTWSKVVALGNLLLIVGVIIIAFANIFRVDLENYHIKLLLPRLIIFAILMNFSYVISVEILRLANAITSTITNNAGSLQLMVTFPETTVNQNTVEAAVISAGVAIVLWLISLITLVALACILVVRVGILWMLVITSPIAYLFSILPFTQKMGSKWWGYFSEWAFMGSAIALCLYIGDTFASYATPVSPPPADNLMLKGGAECSATANNCWNWMLYFGNSFWNYTFSTIAVFIACAMPFILGGDIMKGVKQGYAAAKGGSKWARETGTYQRTSAHLRKDFGMGRDTRARGHYDLDELNKKEISHAFEGTRVGFMGINNSLQTKTDAAMIGARNGDPIYQRYVNENIKDIAPRYKTQRDFDRINPGLWNRVAADPSSAGLSQAVLAKKVLAEHLNTFSGTGSRLRPGIITERRRGS